MSPSRELGLEHLCGLGFRITTNGGSPNPIKASWCDECLLFRSSGIYCLRPNGVCLFPNDPNFEQDYNKPPSPWNWETFVNYRKEIEVQIKKQSIFRSLFVTALDQNPELRCDEFYIQISIKIDQNGINVVGIIIIESDGEHRGREGERKGKILFAFEAHHLDVKVCFEVPIYVSLDHVSDEKEKEYKCCAYEIARWLSDEEPNDAFDWKILSDIRKTRKRNSWRRTFTNMCTIS